MASVLWACLQRVQAACMDREGCAGAMVLPLDICSPTSQLHEAAVEADNAFEGAGVDYLIHNAGMLTVAVFSSLHDKHQPRSLPVSDPQWCNVLGAAHHCSHGRRCM